LGTEGFTIPAIPIEEDAVTPRRGEGSTIRSDLVRMSNQIAANFAHHAPDQAAAEVANHIKMTWPPSMRDELINDVDLGVLDPLTIEAIHLLSGTTPT